MNLEALLGELRGNMLRDDAEIATGPEDSLWSDETLVRYINDAQQRFARKTLSIRDNSTPKVVEVSLSAGVAEYVLDKSVLAVVSGRYDADTTDLARAGHSLLWTHTKVDPSWIEPNTLTEWTPGRPRAFSTDETLDVDVEGAIALTVYPTPSSTEDGKIVHLRVARLPLKEFTIDELEAESEIVKDYQLGMLNWAAFLALSNSDIDGHSAQADKREAQFDKLVRGVLRDVRRKMRVPIRFQFGQNGFRW